MPICVTFNSCDIASQLRVAMSRCNSASLARLPGSHQDVCIVLGDMLTEANEGNEVDRSEPIEKPLPEIARPVFLSWEKLRLIYVGICVVWCLLLTTFIAMSRDARVLSLVVPQCVMGGIIANLCYFAGPIIETYAAWLGLGSHDKLRIVLFVLGTLVTLIGATGLIGSTLIMGFD